MVIRSGFKIWKDETDAVYASSVTNNAQNYLLHFWISFLKVTEVI